MPYSQEYFVLLLKIGSYFKFIYPVNQNNIGFIMFEKEQPQNPRVFNDEVVKMLNTNTRRIRTLEQRLTGSERRIEAMEEKMIDEIEDIKRGFEQISFDIKSLISNLSKIRSEMLKINKNLDKTAKKSEIKELESLLDIYNPIKSNFVTKNELERFLEDKKSR
jgi:argonaute-like protein implicated in RNA metabolism and viral defense